MNERIKELIKSLGIIPEDEHYEVAQLIVKECIQMADEFELEVNKSGLVDRMKCHFGVE